MMLELVVSDDLTPPLECPLCGRLYIRCSLPIPGEGPKCTACGGSFRLTELLPKQQGQHSPPTGVSIADHGGNWSIIVSTRALKKALINAVSGAALLLCAVYIWMHGGWLFTAENNSDGQMLVKLGLILFVFSIGLLGAAVWHFWGRYEVSATGDLGNIFSGVAGLGSKRTFSPPRTNGVSLTKAVSFDRYGNPKERSVIRLEGVGFYMDIGDGLPDEQRAYLALFLLQNRAESDRPTATTAGA